MGEGIKLQSLDVLHKKCGKNKLIDYIGYVWCDYCEEIADPSDILTEEEYLVYLGTLTEEYKGGGKCEKE